MAETHLWVPGAGVRPERYGPDWMWNAHDDDDVELPWTDQQGVTSGYFTGFMMKAHKEIWFHFPFTIPTRREPEQMAPLFLDRIYLLWSCGNNITLRAVTAHTGYPNRFVATVEGGAQAGDHRGGVSPQNTYPVERINGQRPAIVFGLVVCALFRCGERGDGVGFSGAGVVLTDTPA